MVTILYTFPNVFSKFLPVNEIQEQKSYQKGVSFLPSHMLKEMWLYRQTFSLRSAIWIGRLNLMAFPNGSLIKTNIGDISFVLRIPFNPNLKEWYIFYIW